MKPHFTFTLGFALLVLISAGACNSPVLPPPLTPTRTPSQIPISSQTPTSNRTAAPPQTPVSSNTPTFAPTLSPSSTPTPTNTPDPGSWQEVGAGSASGGGISNNAGLKGLPSFEIASDGTLYVAWEDDSNGNWEIYIRAWNGSSWAEVGAGSASGGGISNNAEFSYGPSLAIALDGTPYVAWYDTSSGNSEIYVRAWNGSSWAEVGAGSASGGGISNNNGFSSRPSLALAPDGTLYVAWEDGSSGNTEIYVRAWDGHNWVEVGAGSASGGGISNNAGGSGGPSLALAPDGTLYMAWYDDSSGSGEIYIKAWNGNSWQEVGTGSANGGGISNTGGAPWPSIAIAPDGTPYVAWANESSGEIYIKAWNGSSWGEVGAGSVSGGGISNSTGGSYNPSLALAPDGTPYVAWIDDSNGYGEIYVRAWDGSSWVEVGAGSASGGGITNNAGESLVPSLAFAADGTLYVAWYDNSSGNFEIYVRRFIE